MQPQREPTLSLRDQSTQTQDGSQEIPLERKGLTMSCVREVNSGLLPHAAAFNDLVLQPALRLHTPRTCRHSLT
jgi:hypothetical protein